MADLETTQQKLRSTPTAGVSGEHSPYYRRLLSSGYKGYVQGIIGGGTLYGMIGLGVGAAVGVPLAFFTGGMSLWLIPILGTSLGLYGGHAFADIGKTAAIIAESADTNEKRRYLLDRYYETPNAEEAKEIKRQLEDQHQSHQSEMVFHWRPAIVGALIGVALVATILMLTTPIFTTSAILGAEFLSHITALEFVVHNLTALGTIGSLATGAAVGGLTGSIIGIPREFIRRWLDGASFTVNDPTKLEKEMAEREHDVQKLGEAAKRGQAQQERSSDAIKIEVQETRPTHPIVPDPEKQPEATRPPPVSPHVLAGVREKPATSVSTVALEKQQLQQAEHALT